MTLERVLQSFPPWLSPFFSLSYPIARPKNVDAFPDANYYGMGVLDVCFVFSCFAAMSALRDFVRVCILEPSARRYLTSKFRPVKAVHTNGHAKMANGNGNGHANGNGNGSLLHSKRRDERHIERSVIRFAEQGWLLISYFFVWGYGTYIHINLPTYPFNPTKLWEGFPFEHYPFAGPLKFYYLMQMSLYFHLILVLNAEARRKDHIQMMAHHVITLALIFCSYCYKLTRVGCLIMVLMDLCDILLPLAKVFKYMRMKTLCDSIFVLFMLSWVVTRHILFVLVIKSAYLETEPLFTLDPDTGVPIVPRPLYNSMVALLVILEVLQVIWFAMICRVAWKVVSGKGAEDTRSDDENSDEDEDHSASKKEQ